MSRYKEELSFLHSVRAAQVGDIEQLVMLESVFPEYRLSRAAFTFLLTRATTANVIVYEEKNCIMGDAVMLSRQSQQWARVYSIVVAPQWRGQGIARVLLQTCEQLALTRNCSEVYLELRQDNVEAIGLYKSAGFAICQHLPNYYGAGVDGWRMVKWCR